MIFVSSRRQTRLTAIDLIAFLAGDDNPKKWLSLEEVSVSYSSHFVLYIHKSIVFVSYFTLILLTLFYINTYL